MINLKVHFFSFDLIDRFACCFIIIQALGMYTWFSVHKNLSILDHKYNINPELLRIYFHGDFFFLVTSCQMPLPKLTFCAPGSECYLLASWFDAPKCAEIPFVPSILESISANSPKSFCLLPFTTLRHPIWCVHVKFYFFPKWKCSRARC